MEAQGGGSVLLTRGDLALRLGLPVYGVMAFSAVHTDGIQSSIPAPGLGLVNVAARGGPAGSGSPLSNALQRFHLNADDIALVYKHDTSTKANDKNENLIHDRILNAIGRSKGNPLLIVSQKSLTGHSKGGAAAWQLNGLLQTLRTGTVAPNRSLQEVDPAMNAFSNTCFTDSPLQFGPHALRAGVLSTLGFGHVGAYLLVLHPDMFFHAMAEKDLTGYLYRRAERERACLHRLREIQTDPRRPLFRRVTERHFASETEEISAYLNMEARIGAGERLPALGAVPVGAS